MSRNTNNISNSSCVVGGNGGGSGPCGACKFLRRKCVRDCIFAPYFDSEQGASHFAAVHKVFGASNVTKLLLRLPAHKRLDAVVTICYEAQARIRDPVYGCVSHIFALQQQVVDLQAELEHVQTNLASMKRPTHQPRCIASIPVPALSAPPTPGLSATINPQQLQEEASGGRSPPDSACTIDDDFQALAQEFLSIYFPGVRFPQSKSS